MGSLDMTEKLPATFWVGEVPADPFAQCPEVGAELAKLDAHTAELESIVQQMWEDMATETKLLDGTEVPERETIEIPRIPEEEFWAMVVNLNGQAENEQAPTEESPSTS